MKTKKTDRANLTSDEIAAAEKVLAQANETKGQAGGQNNPNEPKSDNGGETPKAKETSEAEKLIAKYRKAYPANKTFYITSDNQIFLADARNLALLHQRSLQGGEVQTFKV